MLYSCRLHDVGLHDAVPGSFCLGMLQVSYILPARSAVLRTFNYTYGSDVILSHLANQLSGSKGAGP